VSLVDGGGAAVRFEPFHEQAHRDHGYELVDVPAGPISERVELVDGYIRSWVG
jgi:predicted ATPase